MTDNASIAADIAEMNRLMKVYATFGAESLIAKLLNAEIDRLSDVIEAALKVETPDLVIRLIPAGGMALTAEQVEDVRRLLDELTSERDECDTWDLYERLRALFPATEPAEDAVGDPLQAWKGFLKPKPIGWYRTMELDFAAKHFGFPVKPDSGDWFTASDGGKWCSESNEWELRYYPPAPAEPVEEEAVLAARGEGWYEGYEVGLEYGPIAASGEEYDGPINPYDVPVSSPVVPAPTETEWQTWDAVPDDTPYHGTTENGLLTETIWVNKSGARHAHRPSGYVNEFGDYADYEMHNFAPFVAAEEG